MFSVGWLVHLDLNNLQYDETLYSQAPEGDAVFDAHGTSFGNLNRRYSWKSHVVQNFTTVTGESSWFDLSFLYQQGFDQNLEGGKLKDYKTGNDIGLTLFRYGGFYWKFIVNEDWKTLDSKSTLRKG